MTVVDNGDGKFGAGDTVQVNNGAVRKMDDPALAEEMRAKGIQLTALIGVSTKDLQSKITATAEPLVLGNDSFVIGGCGHSRSLQILRPSVGNAACCSFPGWSGEQGARYYSPGIKYY